MKMKISNVVGARKMLFSSFVFVLACLLGTVSLNAQSLQLNDGKAKKESTLKFPDEDQLLQDIAADFASWKQVKSANPLVEVDRSVRVAFLGGLVSALRERQMLPIRAFDYAEEQAKKRAKDFSVPVNVSQIRNEYFDKYSK